MKSTVITIKCVRRKNQKMTKSKMINTILEDISDWDLDELIDFVRFKRKEELQDLTHIELKEQYDEIQKATKLREE
jgi:hypothetical protein